jgi:acylphosphatase
MKCVHIVARGVVQGVFFRANIERKAKELRLNGYIKNLNDGSVEIIAEGDIEKIKKLIEFCKSSPGISKVMNISVNYKKIEGFKNFEIKY